MKLFCFRVTPSDSFIETIEITLERPSASTDPSTPLLAGLQPMNTNRA